MMLERRNTEKRIQSVINCFILQVSYTSILFSFKYIWKHCQFEAI